MRGIVKPSETAKWNLRLSQAQPPCNPGLFSLFSGDVCGLWGGVETKELAEMDLLTEARALFEKKNAMPVLPIDDQARIAESHEKIEPALCPRWSLLEQPILQKLGAQLLALDGLNFRNAIELL